MCWHMPPGVCRIRVASTPHYERRRTTGNGISPFRARAEGEKMNRRYYALEFSREWVLSRRGDGDLPVDVLADVLTKLNGFEKGSSTFTELHFSLDADVPQEDVLRSVEDLLRLRYGVEKDDVVLNFFVGNAVEPDDSIFPDEAADAFEELEYKAEKEKKETAEEKGGAKRAERGAKRGGGSGKSEEKVIPAEEIAVRTVQSSISKLVGAKEFKQLADEIAKVAPLLSSGNLPEVFRRRSYLFSIGDGDGLSTYLGLFASLITATGLRRVDERAVTEIKVPSGEFYKDPDDAFEAALNALGSSYSGGKKKAKLVCADISEWMDNTNSEAFKRFLRRVENSLDDCVVVFRVPFVDKDVLASLAHSLSDLLTVRTVTFPPLGREEITLCAKQELDEYGFTMASRGWKHFHERIAEEKRDGKFYGLNTVHKVVAELVYSKQLRNAEKGQTSTVISPADAKAICEEEAPGSKLRGAEELEKLVGMSSVKRQINEIVAQIAFAERHDGARPCVNMRFVGNPGTGKTTVARILGKMLKEQGVLRIGDLHECSGRDLCGRYVGETAPKTASICRDAYGSVLFIDEAYSLFRGDGNDRDYGREALDTLIAEMENHRDDLVVIMAGYTDDMETLMQGNAGLRSRMPYCIEFPNFTRAELADIFRSMAQGRFKCEEGLFDMVDAYFDGLADETLASKEFSNARFVRNLFERTWAKAAMRCQLGGTAEVTLTKADFERASAEKDFAFNIPKRPRIGF